MSRSVNEPLAVGKEISTRRAAFSGAHKPHVRSIDVHAEDLIALVRRPGRLEDQLAAVKRKIGFSVLAAESELLQVLEMRFPCYLSRTLNRFFGSDRDLTQGDK